MLEFSLKASQCFLNIPTVSPNHLREYYDFSFMGTNKMIPAQSLVCFAREDLGSPEGCGKAPPSRPCPDRDCCVQETDSEGGSCGHRCRLSLSQPVSLSMSSSHEGRHFPCSWVFLLDASPTLNSSFVHQKTATFAKMPLHLPFLQWSGKRLAIKSQRQRQPSCKGPDSASWG